MFILFSFKERTKNAQFIIISLRNNMFELCNRLFGIYKVRNCTSATYIAPDLIELDEKKKQAANKQLKENSRPEIEAAAAVEDKERQELNTTHDHTIRANLNATNINAWSFSFFCLYFFLVLRNYSIFYMI